MAPTIAEVFPQRKLRSRSVATPKKSTFTEIQPKTEKKKSRSRDVSLLRGVVQSPIKKLPLKSIKLNLASPVQSPVKGSPIKKLPLTSIQSNLASPIKKSPLKSIQLNSPRKQIKGSKKALFEDSPTRKTSLFRPDLTRLSEAKYALSSSIPDEIFGREKQIKKMQEFLESNLNEQSKKKSSKKRSIYVSGPPGKFIIFISLLSFMRNRVKLYFIVEI